jgi:hypothetical protein
VGVLSGVLDVETYSRRRPSCMSLKGCLNSLSLIGCESSDDDDNKSIRPNMAVGTLSDSRDVEMYNRDSPS